AMLTKADRYNMLASVAIVGAVVLGLAASIAGFLRQAVAAGVLSLIAVGATGTAKAMSVNERAIFYQGLSGRANTLKADVKLDSKLTLEQYQGLKTTFLKIVDDASKEPTLGNSSQVVEQLISASASLAEKKK